MAHETREWIDEILGLVVLVDLASPSALDELRVALDSVAASDGASVAAITSCQQAIAKAAGRGAAAVVEALSVIERELRTLAGEVPPPTSVDSAVFVLPEHVDAEIFGEFLANQRLALDELMASILGLKSASSEALGAVRRQLHTLKGEAGVLGLAALEEVCHATEGFLELDLPAWRRVDELLVVKDWIEAALHDYAEGLVPKLPAATVLTRFSSSEGPTLSTGAKPECAGPVVAPTMAPVLGVHPPALSEPARAQASDVVTEASQHSWDEEQVLLVGEFLQESTDGLASVDQTLLEIEHHGVEGESVNRLFRVFHTIKGVSGFLELRDIIDLSHATETMLDAVRSGKLEASGAVLDLVFDSTALMRELVASVRTAVETGAGVVANGTVAALIERLGRATQGQLEPVSVDVTADPNDRLGDILVRQASISPSALSESLRAAQASGRRIGEELLVSGAVPAKEIAHALRAQSAARGQAATRIKEVVKVDLERVDCLVETIGELVIVESMVAHAPEVLALPRHVRNYLSQLAKITRELQEIGMRMRMVPVRAEFHKMTRMVRDLARKAGKEIRVDVAGEATEMDRSMVERIADPLVHLIRNAVDHGIEPPAGRAAAGKPPQGVVRLSAFHEGASIVVLVGDDGRGIDREKVFAKAVSRGLVRPDAKLTDAEVYDLIFAPGFSTAEQVTEVSGRGVGMDVVKRNVESMRGRIQIQTQLGRGTTFRIVLPLTLAIIDGMVVRAGAERFIIPTLNIFESLQPDATMLKRMAGQHELVVVRGESLPLLRIDRVLHVAGSQQDPTQGLIVIVESVLGKVGLLVDEVLSQQQVVIKSMGTGTDDIDVFSGAAILSDGRVGLIINVDVLIAQGARAERAARDSEVVPHAPQPQAAVEPAAMGA